MREPLNADDFEALAREKLDAAVFDYLAGGAADELTLSNNRAAFRRLTLRPRVLVDVSSVDTTITLFGRRLTLPILLAPTAVNRLAHPEGELAAARGAAAAGAAMVASTFASYPIEDIAGAAKAGLWFQTYVFRNRDQTRSLIARAQEAGCEAIVLTVDTPRIGLRERDRRNRFQLPANVVAANLPHADPTFADLASLHELTDPSITWSVIEWLRGVTTLPIVLKGVLTAEDARLALDAGIDGLIVSNHGGRQLDGAPAALDALPEVAAVAGDRIPVLLDGGVRRGTDVLKALALGARAVLIGRAYLWALAAAGDSGVQHLFRLLHEELALAMALTGCASLAGISRTLVGPPTDH